MCLRAVVCPCVRTRNGVAVGDRGNKGIFDSTSVDLLLNVALVGWLFVMQMMTIGMMKVDDDNEEREN